VRRGATGGGHGLAEPAVPPLTRDGPAAESALVAEHLGKRFGDRVAFDDVSFEVGYGEVAANENPAKGASRCRQRSS
jgi:hypothetical protein